MVAQPPPPDDEHICKPGAQVYFCPTSGETESDCHGGFDVCCARPDLHRPVTDPDDPDPTSAHVTDADYAVLLPLQKLIDRTIRTTPVRAGNPHDLDRLTADLTLRVCAWVGRNVLPGVRTAPTEETDHA